MSDATDFNTWAARFLWPMNLPRACPAWDLDAGSEACADWVRTLQQEHGLLVDGELGATTMFVCMARYGEVDGAVGSALIGGQEVDLGVPVVRLFDPAASASQVVAPTLGLLLSNPRLELTAARRLRGELPIRSHFSIESGRGLEGRSLVLQWADPLRRVDFVPVDELPSETWPLGRHGVAIELENPLVTRDARREARTRKREREVVSAQVDGTRGRQLAYFPEQLATLDRLLDALAEVGVPRRFPRDAADSRYDTDARGPEGWADWEGWLGRFHVFNYLFEPGMGLADALPALFGALSAPAEPDTPASRRRRPPPPPREEEPPAPAPRPRRPRREIPRRPAASTRPTEHVMPGPRDRRPPRERIARRLEGPMPWMVDEGWFEPDGHGGWRATNTCPAQFSGHAASSASSVVVPEVRASGDAAPAPAPAAREAPPGEREAAWAVDGPSGLAPVFDDETPTFSMRGALGKRNRRTGRRRSRLDALRNRLLRDAADDD